MSFIRPSVVAFLRRRADAMAGVGFILLGAWIAVRGGLIGIATGFGVMLLGGAWLILAIRRAPFLTDPDAPGVVEIDEGRLRYLHPLMNGEIALQELVALDLLALGGRRVWHLRDMRGDTLLIPLDAADAGALFDAFASLPGLGSGALAMALAEEEMIVGERTGDIGTITVWRRAGTEPVSPTGGRGAARNGPGLS